MPESKLSDERLRSIRGTLASLHHNLEHGVGVANNSTMIDVIGDLLSHIDALVASRKADIDAAVAAEREACARTAQNVTGATSNFIAGRIRARGGSHA